MTLPTPGVWYVWLKVKATGEDAAAVSYDLDGRRFKSGRGRIIIGPYRPAGWVSETAQAEFRAEVFADRPGDHTLRLEMYNGEVSIDRIALTLCYGAKPAGETLDHTDDPGGGRAFFPSTGWDEAGYHPDRPGGKVLGTRGFFVDGEKGDDHRDGLAADRAWRSLAPLNDRTFRPGDVILLKRGSIFAGPLRPGGSGTKELRIILGAYGEGSDPLIEGRGRTAVRLDNQSYWTIQDLAVSGGTGHEAEGLRVACSTTISGDRPRGIRITNVVASESGGVGISVGGSYGTSDGIDDVVIDNCLAYANAGGGILVEGYHQKGWYNAVIRDCTAWSNNGWGGIYLNGGCNGLIVNCRAFNNYFLNLWFWNCVNVTARRCETFRGHTSHEAGGFDLDYSVNASTIEYCYSHHNAHYGFMLMGAGTGTEDAAKTSRHNLVRFCVAEDDRPPFWVIETFQASLVHNCLAIATGKGRAACEVTGWPEDEGHEQGGWPSGCRLMNNLFIGRGGAIPLMVDDEASRGGNALDYNWLWQMEPGQPLVRWGGTNYRPADWGLKNKAVPWRTFFTLAEYRKGSGQDAHGGAGDPHLAGPVGAGGLGLTALEAYRPKPGSPVVGAAGPDVEPEAWLNDRSLYTADTLTPVAPPPVPLLFVPATANYLGAAAPSSTLAIGPLAP